MNKVTLTGHLTKDPEVRYTQTGKVVASFTLAVDKYSGDGKKEADFIPVVVWGKTAEICGDNLTKGRKVLVDGRLQVRSYEDKQGQKRWVTEVVGQSVEFLDYKQDGSDNKNSNQPDNYDPGIIPDEDVPF